MSSDSCEVTVAHLVHFGRHMASANGTQVSAKHSKRDESVSAHVLLNFCVGGSVGVNKIYV